MAAISEILARSPAALEDLAGRMDNRERLAYCLNKLSDRNRRMLEMRYREGLNSNVIAESMSSTAEAIRRALFRINNALRQCLLQNENAGATQ